MTTAALVLLVVFTLIASFDGFWFHLYVYRLHERPECRREHLLHTVNAVLFPLTLLPLFLAEASGAWLWFTVLVHLAVVAVELVDVLIEPTSRADLGGLTGSEAALHFLMSGLRWAYVALMFAAVPFERWSAPTALTFRSPLSGIESFVPWAVAIVGVPIALLHVALAARARPVATEPAR